MGFEELASRRVRRQHSLDPLAQVRVLATPLGDVRRPIIGREFAGGIEDYFFPISVSAHDTKGLVPETTLFPTRNGHTGKNLESQGIPELLRGRLRLVARGERVGFVG
jgi:hypothetical protein